MVVNKQNAELEQAQELVNVVETSEGSIAVDVPLMKCVSVA